MKRFDLAYGTGLAMLATWIWTRDLAWTLISPDVGALLLAFPALVYLGSPWELSPEEKTRWSPWLLPSTVALLGGLTANLTLLMAMAWAGYLAAWMEIRLLPETSRNRGGLLALAVLAFPWIPQDLPNLGTFFRASAAGAVEHGFAGLGLSTFRVGTELWIEGLPVQVAAPCSGVNTLQATLVLGLVLAYLTLGARLRLSVVLPYLVGLAWLGNTLRLAFLCLAGLTLGAPATQGAIHDTGGMVVTTLVLLAGFRLLESTGRGAEPEVGL